MDQNSNNSKGNGFSAKSAVHRNGNGPSHTNGAVQNGSVDHSGDKAPHPFVYKLYPTTTDKIVWTLMAFTLAPLKLFGVLFFLAMAWIPASIAVFGWPILATEPLTGWRLALKKVTVLLVRGAWFSAGIMSQKVKGTQASSKEAPVIVMGPHSSFVDTLGGAVCGFPGVVSVIENAHLPLVGTLFRVNESIYVTRGDPDSRRKTAQQIKDRAARGGIWPQLVIFPEGMCATATCVLPYKAGAFLPGVSVQPVTIKYNNRLDITTWVQSGPGLLALFSLLLVTPYSRFECEFHPVYHPSEEEKSNPELYARNVRDLMSRYLGLPKTDIGYKELQDLVKQTKPNRSVIHMWKNIITKGYIEMPSKEHLS